MSTPDMPSQPESDEQTLAGDIQIQPTLERRPGSPRSSAEGPTGPRQRHREFQRGDEVGRYVILERVGAGGMGVVYAAWDPKLDRKVALKLLLLDQHDHSQRLEREAMAMARLTHPNVIVVHDFGEVGGSGELGGPLFVAMEFVEGQTLSEWIEQEPEPRAWSEILEVLLAAGRGLAAAHAQDLIHRDFKPDNVMVGVDGRVRVMDFGLVRTSAEQGDEDAPRASPAGARQTGAVEARTREITGALDSQLTLAGSLLGTPAYMAPEQWLGAEIDARADQFSYCVAVWQCLYGVRPFAGDSPLAISFAVTQGNFSEPPPGRTVPSWVRRALERGLASDPKARWPNMPSLLAALTNDPMAKRRPLLLGGASLALAVAAATAAIVLKEPPPPPCVHAGDELRELWTTERRAGLAAGFAASELVYAKDTWDRVGPQLDDWAAAWIDARRTTCESQLRQEQSAELLDLRMACLDQRLDRFVAVAKLFATPDDEVIEKAVEAVEALPELGFCSDRSWLLAALRPPEDPELAAAVAALRKDLATVAVMAPAGKAAEVSELALQSAAQAAQLGWPPIIAEAGLHLGLVHHELAEFAEARAVLEQAYFTARRSGHDEVAIQAAILLIYDLSAGLGELEAAARWINHALAEGERLGREDLLAELHSAVGIHHYFKGEVAVAVEAFARALELHAGAQSSSLASAHINYATILASVDPSQRERIFAELELGLAMLEETLGSRHPHVAGALGNYATVHGYFNQRREAIALLERSLALTTELRGPKHPSVALAALNLSTNLVESSEREELLRALELARRSGEIHREVLGEAHVMVAQSERAIGKALGELGEPAEAIPHLEAAFAIWLATFDDAHIEVDRTRLERARCEIDLGELAAARASLELILSHLPGEAKTQARAKLALAELIANEAPDRAAELLEQAKTYFAATGGEREQRRVAALEQIIESMNVAQEPERASSR